MAAERFAELFTAMQGQDPATAIATALAGIEADLCREFNSKNAQNNANKKWSEKIGKDPNMFQFDGKSQDGQKGFAVWKLHFELAIEHC